MKPELMKKFSTSLEKLEKRLPLEKFIPSAFLISMLCLFILSLITFTNIRRYGEDISSLNKANEIIKQVDRIKILLIEIPLIRRAHIITGESKYINAIDSMDAESKKQITKLKLITSNEILNQNVIMRLDSLAKINSQLVNSSLRDKNASVIDTFQVDVTKKIQSNLDEIIKNSEEIVQEELLMLKLNTENVRSANFTLQIFIILTGLFTFLVIGLSLYISSKLIKNKNIAEKLLIKSYEDLEDTVEERTGELSKANEKLKDENSERKKIENTLRESEHRFKTLADSAPVLIWITGRDKLSTYVNKGWLEFSGRTEEEELGDGWTEIVHPDDLKHCMQIYNDAFENKKPFELELRLRNANGEYIWFLTRGVPKYEGNEFAGYIGSCIDINSRKKNETYLSIQYEVSKTLSESSTIEEMSKRVLKDVCSGIRWNFGILWTISEENMKVNSIWSENENDTLEYTRTYDKYFTLPKGKGLPGSVYNDRKSKWINNIQDDKTFLRKEAAK
ncbi:MAG: PAS domain S-box protein, partial [Ignavibacteria bacterium]